MSAQPMVKSRLKLLLSERNTELIRAGQSPLTVRELAERAHLSPSVVSGLTAGRSTQVQFATIDKLCRALNCQPGDLFEYVPDATP